MSTRSIVAVKTEAGIVGRYCHFDGYPENKLPHLYALIGHHGAQEAAATLLAADRGGWSIISAEPVENTLGDRSGVVEGYGMRYLDLPVEAPLRWEDIAADRGDLEWGYIIDPQTGTIETYQLTEDGPVRFHHPADDAMREIVATLGAKGTAPAPKPASVSVSAPERTSVSDLGHLQYENAQGSLF